MLPRLLLGFVAFPLLCFSIYPEYPVIAWFLIPLVVNTVFELGKNKKFPIYPFDDGGW